MINIKNERGYITQKTLKDTANNYCTEDKLQNNTTNNYCVTANLKTKQHYNLKRGQGEYYKQLYSNRFDSLDDMGKSFEKYKLPKNYQTH